MDVGVEQALDEAFRALGEATVRERLLAAELARVTAALAAATASTDTP